MSKDCSLSRRSFASVLAASSFRNPPGANDGIRAGVIGSGNRGRLLMRAANLLPGVSLVAVEEVGAASALCSHLSDMALRERRMVIWDANRKEAS